MNFKNFFRVPTQSSDPTLKKSLENHSKKVSEKYKRLIVESSKLETQRHLVHILNQILNTLDPEKDRVAIQDLEYIIRLYQEWADLNQEILSNMKIVRKSELIEEQLGEGEGWKQGTPLHKKELRIHHELEPQNKIFEEANESMNSRINEMQEDLDNAVHQFELDHPKIFDRFFELAEQSQENRTN